MKIQFNQTDNCQLPNNLKRKEPSSMQEPIFIQLYLRKTNGTGDKILLNSKLTILQLYNVAGKIFNLSLPTFQLFFKGEKLPNYSGETLAKYRIEKGSIIHIQEKNAGEEQNFQIKVFCQGEVYTYRTVQQNSIYSLKEELVKVINCHIDDITVSYIGKILEDSENFIENSIKNNDLLSVTLTIQKLDQINELQLHAKLVESVTFSSSQINSKDRQFKKQKKRNPSIKSTQQIFLGIGDYNSGLLHSQRTKSQKSMNLQSIMKKSEGNLRNSKFDGFHKGKIIQTESITLDDPDFQEEYENWEECQIQFLNYDKTQQYIIECNDTHTLPQVINVLAKHLSKKPEKLLLIFGDQNTQKMAESGKTLVEISKLNRTKIINHVIFK